MNSEDRKPSMDRGDAYDERASRASDAGTVDTGASDEVSDVTSGKGRRDEVGHTGIYPASSATDAPADAELVTPGEMGRARERAGAPSEGAGSAQSPDSERAVSEDENLTSPSEEPDIVPEGERSER